MNSSNQLLMIIIICNYVLNIVCTILTISIAYGTNQICDNKYFYYTLAQLFQNIGISITFAYIMAYERLYIYPLFLYLMKIFIYKYPDFRNFSMCYNDYPLFDIIYNYDAILWGATLFLYFIILNNKFKTQDQQPVDVDYSMF